MSAITFHVAGEPKPQPRVQFRIIRTRGGKSFGQPYTPDGADDWKRAVRRAALVAVRGELLTGPVCVVLRFVMPRPESHFTKAGLRPGAPAFHTNERADIDNLTKAVLDALTRTEKADGIWDGDGIVCQLSAEKRYALEGEEPGCEVTISRAVPFPVVEGLFAQEAAS